MKSKKEYPQDFKTMFGLSTMGLMSVAGASFMTSLFMLYLTDYAGIGAMAAVLGTVLLLVGRIVDAVDDPLQGWIMDSARITKIGKYKPFCFISTITILISIIALYNIPSAVVQKPALIVLWVVLFYLVYDIGISFYAAEPLKQTLTDDVNVRAKMAMWPRIIGMLGAMPFAFFLAMTTGLNQRIGDMNRSFSLMAIILIVPIALLSLLGTVLVKEGKYSHVETEKRAKLSMKDIFDMLKTNEPLKAQFLAVLFSGFIWTMVFATATYYVKWAYCADLTTGAIDSGKFALLTTVMGAMQMLPLLIGAFIAPVIIKKLGDPLRTTKLSMVLSVIIGVVFFLMKIVGLLELSPALYFIMLFLQLLATGINFVPAMNIWLECMDYGVYKTGKTTSALVDAMRKFLEKGQTALSSAMVGGILIAIGYQVDSVTDTYVGDLAAIPGMLNWFMVVSALLPALLALVAYLIYRFRYPITPEIREEMALELAKRKADAPQE